MPNPNRSDVPAPRPVRVPHTGSTRWIDLLLVTAGAILALHGLALAGVPLMLVALLLPFRQWRARRAGGIDHLLPLVPSEVADAHQAVVAAAGRPGIVDPADAITAADELVLEVAAVLGGRPARRSSQRRFVEVRLAALERLVTELTERHEAWRAAMDELDALASPELGVTAVEPPAGSTWLSTLLLVLLAPAFLFVDLLRGVVRLAVALFEGVALRIRTVVDLVLAGLAAVGRAIAGALVSWRALVASVRLAVRTARGRFVAGRALAGRRLRRSPRGLGRHSA
jgi:hypothetical protein